MSYWPAIRTAVAIAARIEAGNTSAALHEGTTAFLGVSVSSNGYAGSGAMVEAIVPGGAAANGGLLVSDVITSIDRRTVTSPATLKTILLSEKAGARVSATYLDSSGASHTTTITLASGPAQ